MKILEQITWGQFIAAISLLTIGYYIIIVLLLKIKPGSFKALGKTDSGDEVPEQETGTAIDDRTPEHELMAELEMIVDDVRRGILEAGDKSVTKAELLQRIMKRVSNFGGLHRPAYRYALNNFIIKNAKEICGVDYDEEELEAAWSSLPR